MVDLRRSDQSKVEGNPGVDASGSSGRRQVVKRAAAAVGSLALVLAGIGWYRNGGKLLPWLSRYPRTTEVTRADDGSGSCANTTIFAFGYMWGAGAQVGPGIFRQVDRTHGVLNGVMFTGGVSRFSDLECAIPQPPPEVAHALPAVSQPPNPCELLTANDVSAAAVGRYSDGLSMSARRVALATGAVPERQCSWDSDTGGASPLTVAVWTAAADAAAKAALQRAGPETGPTWPNFQDNPTLATDFAEEPDTTHYACTKVDVTLYGYPAQYCSSAEYSGLVVRTPTAVVAVSYDNGTVNEPTRKTIVTKLVTLAAGRVASTGP
jgi:hypothetical protein